MSSVYIKNKDIHTTPSVNLNNNSTQKTSEEYTIEEKKTRKDDIIQPPDVEAGIIPPLGSSLILCGKSGSGKSTLLASLLNDEKGRFYTGFFDHVFLFSPTAGGDDIQKQYGVTENHVFTDLEESIEILQTIQEAQKEAVKQAGADKAPNYALIFDDIIGDTKFMNSKEFVKCFYQSRHINCTTFLCTQHYKRVPRVCRLQAGFVCFFKGSRSEVEMICEEFAPPLIHKDHFTAIVDGVTSKPYAFFTINMKVDWTERFRNCLWPVIHIGGEGSENIISDNKEGNKGIKVLDKEEDADSETRPESTDLSRPRKSKLKTSKGTGN
jgi:ABC-type dipeptide/oligopeptide/nickel transport system ATPase subunit